MTYDEMMTLKQLGLYAECVAELGNGCGARAYYLIGWANAHQSIIPPRCDPKEDYLGAARRKGWEDQALYRSPMTDNALGLDKARRDE